MTDGNRDIKRRIDEVITAVYREKSINPWSKRRAHSEKYEKLFRTKLSEWPLRNQTDFEHGGATAISFLLHPGHVHGVPTRDGLETRINRLGGACYQALLEISHLGPFARVRFTLETFDRETGDLAYDERESPIRTQDYHFLLSLRLLLLEENIEILDRELLEELVPDVQLDVTRLGNVTVYHCLFDEE